MTDFIYIQLGIDAEMYVIQTHKDHNGNISRAQWLMHRHRGFGLAEVEPERPLKEYGLLIPCTRQVTNAIRDFTDFQEMMAPEGSAHTHFGPYYFTTNMSRSTRFEPNVYASPILFAGEDTAYFPDLADKEELSPGWFSRLFQRRAPDSGADSNGLCNARYNCWTGAQGVTQYVGGVDLGRIHRGFAHSYRVWTANACQIELMKALQAGTDNHYETVLNGGGLVLARRRGEAPFMLVDRAHKSIAQILGSRLTA